MVELPLLHTAIRMHSPCNLRFRKQPPGPSTVSYDLRRKRLPEHLNELITHIVLHVIKRHRVLTASLEDLKLFLYTSS